MSKVLEHKGIKGTVEFDTENLIMYGKLLGIRDTIEYKAQSAERFYENFKYAVDEYLNNFDDHKNYEIIEFHDGFNRYYKMKDTDAFTINTTHMYTETELLGRGYKIIGVRRKSDRTLFRVGDNFTNQYVKNNRWSAKWQIAGFRRSNNNESITIQHAGEFDDLSDNCGIEKAVLLP